METWNSEKWNTTLSIHKYKTEELSPHSPSSGRMSTLSGLKLVTDILRRDYPRINLTMSKTIGM